MTGLDCKLEIYKIFVGTITASENRRQQASTVYLGMIAAVFTVMASIKNIELIFPVLVILVTSVLWWLTINYFRRLAKAKFSVIAPLRKPNTIQQNSVC